MFILQVISRKCPTFECWRVAEAVAQVSKSPDKASIAALSSAGFCNNFNSEVTKYATQLPTVKLIVQEFVSALINYPFLKEKHTWTVPFLHIWQRCLFEISKRCDFLNIHNAAAHKNPSYCEELLFTKVLLSTLFLLPPAFMSICSESPLKPTVTPLWNKIRAQSMEKNTE